MLENLRGPVAWFDMVSAGRRPFFVVWFIALLACATDAHAATRCTATMASVNRTAPAWDTTWVPAVSRSGDG